MAIVDTLSAGDAGRYFKRAKLKLLGRGAASIGAGAATLDGWSLDSDEVKDDGAITRAMEKVRKSDLRKKYFSSSILLDVELLQVVMRDMSLF